MTGTLPSRVSLEWHMMAPGLHAQILPLPHMLSVDGVLVPLALEHECTYLHACNMCSDCHAIP